MSSKNVLYESKDMRLRYDVAVALHRIADGIADGTIHIKDDYGSVCMAVDDKVKFEVEIEEKVKSEGIKRSIELEIEWYEKTGE